MTLDKDDLFRNGIPGLVFIIVLLSFVVLNGGSIDFDRNIVSFLSIFAAFPIGFAIQTIYRWFHMLREQEEMRTTELNLIEPESELRRTVRRLSRNIKVTENTVFTQLVAFSLDRPENNFYKIRINFNLAYFCALGASSIAIFFALLIVWLVSSSIFYLNFLWIIWSMIAIVFWIRKEFVRGEYQACRNIFISLKRNQIKKNFKYQEDSI